MISKCILIPFSFIYYFFISIRDIFYRVHIFREHALDAKVISVGNMTWGGTGKTPLVLLLAEKILEKGFNPAILIRGYGNDEVHLLSKLKDRVPILVGKDRVENGQSAIANYSIDTLLLDDGFQYRRLKRDLDIVCIDAIKPFGNGWVIPGGSMREGLNGLKRADIFLITKVDLINDKKALQELECKLKRINPDALIVKSIHDVQHFYKLSNEQLVDIEQLKNKKIILVSAIGSPESFEKTILKCGLKFKKHFIFRDHHWYNDKDLERIEGYCAKHGIDTVIITEKDAVRLQTSGHTPYKNQRFCMGSELPTPNFLVLSIRLKIIENEERFFNRLFGIYNS